MDEQLLEMVGGVPSSLKLRRGKWGNRERSCVLDGMRLGC